MWLVVWYSGCGQYNFYVDVGDGVGVAVEETRTSENHMLELLLCCVCLEDR